MWPERLIVPPDWLPPEPAAPVPEVEVGLAADRAPPESGAAVEEPSPPAQPAPVEVPALAEPALVEPPAPAEPAPMEEPAPAQPAPVEVGGDGRPAARRPATRPARHAGRLLVVTVLAGLIAAAYLLPEQAIGPPPPQVSVGTPGVPGQVTGGSPAPSAAQARTQATTGATPGSQPQMLAETSRKPFEVGGVRFAVFVDPNQSWTASARSVPPGDGMRWELVAVRTRNLTRASFDPTTVPYSLIAADGSGYAPDPAEGTGPEVVRPPTVTRPGGLAEAELAFQVPAADHGFRLVFDPSGQGLTVLVTLG